MEKTRICEILLWLFQTRTGHLNSELDDYLYRGMTEFEFSSEENINKILELSKKVDKGIYSTSHSKLVDACIDFLAIENLMRIPTMDYTIRSFLHNSYLQKSILIAEALSDMKQFFQAKHQQAA